MNQTELIQQVADEANLTKTQTQDAVRALLKTIMQVVADGDKVTLVGFGSFEPKVRSAREGRNPKTGETIQIPAARVRLFQQGKHLGRRLTNDRPSTILRCRTFKRYDAELQQLESLPPAAIELDAKGALAL
jgi:DNA-binding protein HU-beta